MERLAKSLPLLPSQLPEAGRRTVPDAVLVRMQRLYDQGLYLQAYAEAAQAGDPRLWIGTRALVWASRLANNLGAPRLASARALQAFRGDRGDAEALFYAANAVLGRKGPLAARRFLERHEPRIIAASTERRADLVALKARISAQFRDFARAEALIAEAARLCPDSAWILVERSLILRAADRYEDSLAAARHAVAMHPGYRPAIQALAQASSLLGQADEAVRVLEQATKSLESGAVWLQLTDHYIERGDLAGAGRAYGEFERLSPMREPAVDAWLAGARARVAYLRGERAEATAFARAAGGYYHTKMAASLEAAPAGARRTELPVAFLRQHHMTCAPTCLAMISAFFARPADQDAIAAEICYDGTEDHKERHWAEQNGWVVREFSVDWATTVALIDRGVPFCLNTQETSSAHLQIVIGYDAVLGALLIRDPYTKPTGEFLADEFFERYRHNGPRGMAMVPAGQEHLFDGVPFVDTPRYEERHRLGRALAAHDRDGAAAAVARAEALGADHWIPLAMRLSLARYDDDDKAVLDLTERLYTLNPANKRYLHWRLSTLRDHARQDVRIGILEGLVKKPGCDPAFMVQLADELRFDRQRVEYAEHLLLKSARIQPTDGGTYWYLSEIKRFSRDDGEAAELARIAACLDDKNEFLASAYFNAARFVPGGTEEALRFLAARVASLGEKSSGPARSLHWALVGAERIEESFEVLDDALGIRPEDGALLLYAADAYAKHGHTEVADGLVARAEGRVPPVDLLKARGNIAEIRGEGRAALALWREVAALTPHAAEPHQRVASLIEKTRSRRQAITYVAQLVETHPDNRYFRKMLVEWLRSDDSPALLQALTGLIAVWPQDAWARRELAMHHAGEGRFDLAVAALAAAEAIDAESYGYHFCKGYVARLSGDLRAAQASYLRALERNVDSSSALAQALRSAAAPAEKAAILGHFKDLLVRSQRSTGEGLIAFREQGDGHLSDAAFLGALREIHAAYKHLPEAWTIVIREFAVNGLHDEARALGAEATARFALNADVWLALSDAERIRGDDEAEERALIQAVVAQPSSGSAVRSLAQYYERRGAIEKEAAALTEALARNPLDAGNLAFLADCLWRRGEHRDALVRLQESLTQNARVDWAWGALVRWSAEVGQPEAAGDFARQLAERREDDAWAWFCCARSLRGGDVLGEQLEVLDRALRLDPDLFAAVELKADLLLEAGRVGEALAFMRACDLPHDKRHLLRIKEARTLVGQEDADAALPVIADVLAHEPLGRDGWQLKADAAQMLGDDDAYLEAAEALAAYHPRAATSHGYLGDARARKGDDQGAKSAFRAALELAPDYAFAAYCLFDLELGDGEFEEAEDTLALILEASGREPPAVQREALLVIASGRTAALAGLLAELCALPAAEHARLGVVRDALVKKGLAATALPLISPLLAASATYSAAARLTIWLAVKEAHWDVGAELLRADHDGWAELARDYVQGLIGAKEKHRFASFVLAHRDRLHAHDRSWAVVGHGYGNFRLDRECVTWLNDWKMRKGAHPWLLFNLSLAHRRLGERDEAAAANVAGALSPIKDDGSKSNALWAAFHQATVGKGDDARRFLALGGEGADEHDRMVRELAVAALLHEERGYLAATRAMRALRKWDRGFGNIGFYDAEFRAGVRRLAKVAGGLRPLHAAVEGNWLALYAALGVVLIGVKIIAG